ncbi:hypothetical protein [Hoylesella shahii]|jgi:hypothetical protein|uniref:hypothetical protein n=1 Tax=Hoylesella shahii TaxID=228603 RepID=UPI0028D60237|nr:hypothetical protein [Hoylesella shahii]
MLAMRMFGQTTYGKQFIGSFLNKNQRQYWVKGNGKYSMFTFPILQFDLTNSKDQFDFMPNIEGSFSVREVNGKLNIVLKLEVKNFSTEELVETITHELALHGSKLNKIINAYKKGDMDAVNAIFNSDPEENNEHKDLAKKNSKSLGVRNYEKTREELVRRNPKLKRIFNKEQKKYEKGFAYKKDK